jgi:Flp pilus assembly protein TadD
VGLALAHQARRTLLVAAVDALEARGFVAAATACDRLLSADPNDGDAPLLLGLALAGLGQVMPAARLLNQAAARNGVVHPCQDLANMVDEAALARQVRACLDLAPDDTRLRLLWADCQQRAGEVNAAIATLDALLEDVPANAAAHHRLGMIRAALGEFEAAIACMRQAVALDPVPALGWANLGMLLKVQGRFAESLDAYGQALSRSPADAQIRVNRVVALLHAGHYAEAWLDHEWRFALSDHVGMPDEGLLPPLASLPQVAGSSVAGRRVLLTHEAGFGDTLQFCRYVPLLAARGVRVALAMPRELRRLMDGLAGVSQLVEVGAALPAYDWHCPMTSLPRVFGTTVETIPAEVPYLVADPALVAFWAARLPLGRGLRVGLVWAGASRPWLPGFATVNARRSMGLELFAPFAAIPDVQFVSLQAGAPAGEAARPPVGMVLHDPMPGAADFADTAAIIANLDLVVSVDTSVVHLAGALGKPVFLLDRYDNCWRWLSGRTDSPWYPRLRIFRQARVGEWGPVVRQAADALGEIAARRNRY